MCNPNKEIESYWYFNKMVTLWQQLNQCREEEWTSSINSMWLIKRKEYDGVSSLSRSLQIIWCNVWLNSGRKTHPNSPRKERIMCFVLMTDEIKNFEANFNFGQPIYWLWLVLFLNLMKRKILTFQNSQYMYSQTFQ